MQPGLSIASSKAGVVDSGEHGLNDTPPFRFTRRCFLIVIAGTAGVVGSAPSDPPGGQATGSWPPNRSVSWFQQLGGVGLDQPDFGVWDELVAGSVAKRGWLGPPRGMRFTWPSLRLICSMALASAVLGAGGDVARAGRGSRRKAPPSSSSRCRRRSHPSRSPSPTWSSRAGTWSCRWICWPERAPPIPPASAGMLGPGVWAGRPLGADGDGATDLVPLRSWLPWSWPRADPGQALGGGQRDAAVTPHATVRGAGCCTAWVVGGAVFANRQATRSPSMSMCCSR